MWADLKEKYADSAAPPFRGQTQAGTWCLLLVSPPQVPIFFVVGVACTRLQPLQTHCLSPPSGNRGLGGGDWLYFVKDQIMLTSVW